MNNRFTITSPLRPAALLLATAFVCGSALAGPGAKTGDNAQARYQKERAACLSGQTQQDQKTCLKEAGAAYAEARRGELGDHDNSSLEANARKRCEPLPTADRLACLARMDGKGVSVGNAAAGGIYRELTTIEPAPVAAKAPEANTKDSSVDE